MKKLAICLLLILAMSNVGYAFDISITLKQNIGHEIAMVLKGNPTTGQYLNGVIKDVNEKYLVIVSDTYTCYYALEEIAVFMIKDDASKKQGK